MIVNLNMQISFLDSMCFYAFALFCNASGGLYISDGLFTVVIGGILFFTCFGFRVLPTKGCAIGSNLCF